MRAHVAVLCVLAAIAAPTSARAQEVPTDSASNEADRLAKRGIDLLKQDRFAEAEATLRRAVALKHSYDIVGNLGVAESGLGKWREAAEHLTFALATFPVNGKAGNRELLKEKYAIVRPHVGSLTIDVDTKGADVLVDGASVGTAPLAAEVFVDPGLHVVEARFAGRDPARRDTNVAAGGAASVHLVVPATHAEPVTPPGGGGGGGVVVEDRTPRIALAVTSGALALVGIAVGAGLTVAANGKSSDAATLRAGLTGCAGVTTGSCAALANDASGERGLAQGAAAGFVLGGVFAASAVGFGVWAASGKPKVGLREPSAPFAVKLAGRSVRVEGSW
jgi:hypothetical protein